MFVYKHVVIHKEDKLQIEEIATRLNLPLLVVVKKMIKVYKKILEKRDKNDKKKKKTN